MHGPLKDVGVPTIPQWSFLSFEILDRYFLENTLYINVITSHRHNKFTSDKRR